MPVKAFGAEVVATYDEATLLRTFWKSDGERGQSLRIVRPVSFSERFLVSGDRLSPGVLGRVSVLTYLLFPVLLFLNTIMAHVSWFPYLLVLILSGVLVAVGAVSGSWFVLGGGLVDRVQGSPLYAMKAPAVAVPDWWLSRVDEVSEAMVSAYQKAYLAKVLDEERIREGEVLLGRFLPTQESHHVVSLGLERLAGHKRQLAELLAVESLSDAHAEELARVASEPPVSLESTSGSVAGEAREWLAKSVARTVRGGFS